MIKSIAETAWHHQGDFKFMKDLISRICRESMADVVKMHITLDLDEYMSRDHEAFDTLKSWMLSESQWEELIGIVRTSGKELMLLLNDTSAIEFAARYKPEIVELHSVCLNVPRLQKAVLEQLDRDTKIVIGVGGCTLEEVDAAVQAFEGRETVLMFGFQNYPTRYEDINLAKIRKIQSLYSDKQFGYADHCGWDEPNNELITMTVAANGMGFVEKHVTTAYGQQRCDYSAAITIDMFNSLVDKLKVLHQLNGNGSLQLNAGESAYSKYGPMKMAAIAGRDLQPGDVVSADDICFQRTSQTTSLSQVDIIKMIGKEVSRQITKNEVFQLDHFGENK